MLVLGGGGVGARVGFAVDEVISLGAALSELGIGSGPAVRFSDGNGIANDGKMLECEDVGATSESEVSESKGVGATSKLAEVGTSVAWLSGVGSSVKDSVEEGCSSGEELGVASSLEAATDVTVDWACETEAGSRDASLSAAPLVLSPESMDVVDAAMLLGALSSLVDVLLLFSGVPGVASGEGAEVLAILCSVNVLLLSADVVDDVSEVGVEVGKLS